MHMKKLEEICDLFTGVTLGKTELIEESEENPELPKLLRLSDLLDLHVFNSQAIENLPYLVLTEKQSNKIKSHHYIQTNDIVVTMRGTNFKAVLIKEIPEHIKLIISSNMLVIRPKIDYPEFIGIYLNSNAFQQKHIEAKKDNMLSISVKEARQFALPFPDDTQRVLLHELFYSALDKIEAHKAEIKATQLLVEAALFNQCAIDD